MLEGLLGPRVHAWGNFVSKRVRERLKAMLGVAKTRPNQMVFGLNGTGEPKHPLYLKNTTRIRPWGAT